MKCVIGNTCQIIDDVESVIVLIACINPAVLFLPHMVLQGGLVSKGFLTVQALQTENDMQVYLSLIPFNKG